MAGKNAGSAVKKTASNTAGAPSRRRPGSRRSLEAACNTLFSGNLEEAKSLLHDCIDATIGFEQLSRKMSKTEKSLKRMLSPGVIPRSNDIFRMTHLLLRDKDLHINARARDI